MINNYSSDSTGRLRQGPLRAAIWGCGAVAELCYAPAFKQLPGLFRIDALFDPDASRSEKLKTDFPEAVIVESLAGLPEQIDVIIIACPPAYHAKWAIEALGLGIPVLCEKPLATSAQDARQMLSAGERAGKLLAVGLVRRFYPAAQTIKHVLEQKLLGEVIGLNIAEGGKFEWNARSASLFQQRQAGGGVLMDIGVHVLDLLLWWFGDASIIEYSDDAMGGVESNCLLTVSLPGQVQGTVRLSRDCNLSNSCRIDCQYGSLNWSVCDATALEISFQSSYRLAGRLLPPQAHRASEPALPADSYIEAFKNQLANLADAIDGRKPLETPAHEAIRSLDLIDFCYRNRRLMPMPWLQEKEAQRAIALHAGDS